MNILTLKNKSVWFKCGALKSRHGKVIDSLYDGLLLIMEDDTERVFVASPDDILKESISMILIDLSSIENHSFQQISKLSLND